MIGDPTGKNVTRKPLTKAGCSRECQELIKIKSLKFWIKKKRRLLLTLQWMSKMSSTEMISLASKTYCCKNARA